MLKNFPLEAAENVFSRPFLYKVERKCLKMEKIRSFFVLLLGNKEKHVPITLTKPGQKVYNEEEWRSLTIFDVCKNGARNA